MKRGSRSYSVQVPVPLTREATEGSLSNRHSVNRYLRECVQSGELHSRMRDCGRRRRTNLEQPVSYLQSDTGISHAH
eukprot:scaffold1265_cov366-Prasinococcus_capsulatus_cf.AAC.27